MAKKKDFEEFEAINTGTTSSVLEMAAKATARSYSQREADPEEKARREAEGKTQGRKGCKAPRINLAFESEVYDYCKTMSKIRGMTLTQFCNYAIRQHMEDHGDIYSDAKELIKRELER